MLFMGIDAAKFRKPVVPGDQLDDRGGAAAQGQDHEAASGECRVDGAVVSSAEMLAAIAPRSKVA
jgi:3-hydroxymyristoyl/3-hydroxydecanoyl-(acyl carrier protein) dehydratase